MDKAIPEKSDYKDRTFAIKAIGFFSLLFGILIGFLGPLEMYCFYMFSEGGQFHYEGFGFGSFMFGNISSQIIGYYLIAITLIALGYGHLKMKKWVRTLSLALMWFWLVVGLPLIIIVFFILTGTKDLSVTFAVVSAIFLILSYVVFPILVIRFYNGQNMIKTFEAKDKKIWWIEKVPLQIIVLNLLYILCIAVLHILILFNGIFPFFGVYKYGLEGIVFLDISIFCLLFLIWGSIRLRLWAWWGSVILFAMLTLSAIITFIMSDYSTILSILKFPPREIAFLEGIPIQGYHFAILAGIPLLTTCILAILSKRHYNR